MSYVTKSPWVIHYDGSSCNGCDIEVLACLTPMYDVERFGIINTGNPKHADIFLVTGSVNEQNIGVIKQIYEQMPEPKVVVAIGICATSGGIFKECYNVMGGIDTVIPVDVYVPGCAARPEAIIDGVVKGLGVLAEKRAAMEKKPAAALKAKAEADSKDAAIAEAEENADAQAAAETAVADESGADPAGKAAETKSTAEAAEVKEKEEA
ncbi:MAG TPA: NADH-quinone oxidoreductase subunit B family protein [Anaerovoracaceae bacterium]|nr:NADH-quinone oxidoreductase subunit B family protein [Anaerovoracaceae bacterium]